MKVAMFFTFFLSLLVCGQVALAGSDDVKWITQCMEDNKDAKVSSEVIHRYCACMNEKMDDQDTLSISEWEVLHPDAMSECEILSGWVRPKSG